MAVSGFSTQEDEAEAVVLAEIWAWNLEAHLQEEVDALVQAVEEDHHLREEREERYAANRRE